MIRVTHVFKDDIQINLLARKWYLYEDIQDQLNNRADRRDIKHDLELHHIFHTIEHECWIQEPLISKGL